MASAGVVVVMLSLLLMVYRTAGSGASALPGGRGLMVMRLLAAIAGERVLIAVVAGTAAWAAARASGRKCSIGLQIAASWLSQPIFVASAIVCGLALDALAAPPDVTLGPALFLGGPPLQGPAVMAAGWLMLSMMDLPSILCLTWWGIGMASLEGRRNSSGIVTAFSLYVLAIVVLSLPLFRTGPG